MSETHAASVRYEDVPHRSSKKGTVGSFGHHKETVYGKFKHSIFSTRTLLNIVPFDLVIKVQHDLTALACEPSIALAISPGSKFHPRPGCITQSCPFRAPFADGLVTFDSMTCIDPDLPCPSNAPCHLYPSTPELPKQVRPPRGPSTSLTMLMSAPLSSSRPPSAARRLQPR